ncbi:MAG: S8 family serine peptidase [Acidobacteriota bacterium]
MDFSLIAGLTELREGTSSGDPRITIAVLDGAADLSHPCFENADLHHLGGTAPLRPTAHGTHVASVLFGQSQSIQGIAASCRGIIIPIFEEDGEGNSRPASQLDLARALREAIAAGADLINISGGQLTPSGQAEPFLTDAVQYCADHGALLVAAAGNDGCDCSHVPAALPFVLAVGATDQKGEPLSFSNWGYENSGILTVGTGIVGAGIGGGAEERTGTSFAAPVVTGVAALLLSEQLQQGEEPNPEAVRNALLGGAEACRPQQRKDCERFLAGNLDIRKARKALRLTQSGLCRDEPETTSVPKLEGDVSMAEKNVQQITESTPKVLESEPDCEVVPVAPEVAIHDGGISASSCGGADTRPKLAYAIGELDYDLTSEARRDSILQSMENGNVYEPADLLHHLKQHPAQSEAITWILKLDSTPIYAVRPFGAYAEQTYKRLREFLTSQLEEGVERVSVPGHLSGHTTLFSGQVLPVIVPELRGMYSWSIQALVDACASSKQPKGKTPEEQEKQREDLSNFLRRIYYELRNLGASPEERAANFAATNAFQVTQILQDLAGSGMVLDSIDVEGSPICRPGSECWDVKLTFFDPKNRLTVARQVHRFTVDVSDVIPVTVGPVRSWSIF